MQKTNLYARVGIYAAVPVSILRAKDITFEALRVYCALRSFEGGSPRCFPSTTAIAERAGMQRENVSRAITILVRTGWLESDRRPGRCSIYHTLVPVKLTKGVRFRGIPVTESVTTPPAESVTRKRSMKKLAAARRQKRDDAFIEPLAPEEKRRVASRASGGAWAPLGKRPAGATAARAELAKARGGSEGEAAAVDDEAPVDPEVGLRYLAEIRAKLAAKGKGRRA